MFAYAYSIAFNYYSRLAHVLHVLSGFACVYVVLYLLSYSASNNLYCYRHCGCPACVCVSVRSFLPPRASISRNIGTYVFTATRKTLYIAIIILIFAQNASFRSYGRHHLLAPNATNCSSATKYGYQRNPRRQCLLRAHILNTSKRYSVGPRLTGRT